MSHLARYVAGAGRYPYTCEIRTPLGSAALDLHSSHDVATVTEVFCREDYRCRPDIEVAVDIGSNIGASGLYFLTRNSRCRVYLFEPDPRNTARLRSNLSRFSDRTHLEEAAVVASPSPGGNVSFIRDPTVRYGRVGESLGEAITVRAAAINEALRNVLEQEARVDVLKIDTEGSEPDLVKALAPDVLARIECIYFEATAKHPLHPEIYRHSRALSINRLTRPGPGGAAVS
jgi:FkbM family methyltransferase